MEVIPFGSNGFFSSFGRQTACYVIPMGKKLIILDAGSGLFRFAERRGKQLLEKVGEVHLYLSHYHLDHTFGFYAAFKLFEGKKVLVFASSGRQVFSDFVALKHFPIDYSREHRNFCWNTLKNGEHAADGYKVTVRKQNHRGEESLAFRFSFGLAYITDGEPGRENVTLCRNADVLLCESPFSGEELGDAGSVSLDKQIVDGHITAAGAAKIASEGDVGKLILIHHHPFDSNERLKRKLSVARKIFPRTVLAVDGVSVMF